MPVPQWHTLQVEKTGQKIELSWLYDSLTGVSLRKCNVKGWRSFYLTQCTSSTGTSDSPSLRYGRTHWNFFMDVHTMGPFMIRIPFRTLITSEHMFMGTVHQKGFYRIFDEVILCSSNSRSSVAWRCHAQPGSWCLCLLIFPPFLPNNSHKRCTLTNTSIMVWGSSYFRNFRNHTLSKSWRHVSRSIVGGLQSNYCNYAKLHLLYAGIVQKE